MSARVSIRARPLNGRAPNPAPVRRSAVVIEAAKGRNAKLAGRNKKAQSIEDNKWREGMEAAAAERADKKKAEPKQSGLKYSKRGKVSSQPGQVSKAALKRMKLDLEEKKANDAVSAERMEEKRAQYRAASAKGIPQVVTDRMLKRITIFSGVPLLLGFSTGPLFYLGKTVAHFDAAAAYIDMLPFSQFRMRGACTLPVIIGLKTVTLLRQQNVLDAEYRIKVGRPEIKRMTRQTALALPSRRRTQKLISSYLDA